MNLKKLRTIENCSFRTVLLAAAVLILITPVSSLDINESEPLQYYSGGDLDFEVGTSGEINAYGNTTLNQNSIEDLNRLYSDTSGGNFFGGCEDGKYVESIDSDGSVTCVSDDTGSAEDNQNLSEVLVNGNMANQSIDMDGNNITSLNYLNPDSEFRTGGKFVQEVGTDPEVSDSVTDSNMNGAEGVVASKGYAYVGSANSNSLTVVDVSQKSDLRVVGSVSDAGALGGAEGVGLLGDYVYVAAGGSNALGVVDVSDPTNPEVVGSVSDGTDLNGPERVSVVGRYAYVAAEAGDTMTVVDVSDPTSPEVEGTVVDTTNMERPWDLDIAGKYVYVIGRTSDSLAAVDISDPTSPEVTGGISDTSAMEAPEGIAVSGPWAYVAGSQSDSIAVINVSDPSDPVVAGSVSDPTSLDQVEGVSVAGDYLYVSAEQNDAITIVDVSDPTSPQVAGSVSSASMGTPKDNDMIGGHVFAAGNSGDSLTAVDVTSVDAPSATIGSLATSDLNVLGNAEISRNLNVRSGLNVGPRGITTNGEIVANSSTLTGNLDFAGSNQEITGFFGGSCNNGKVIDDISNDGTFNCVDPATDVSTENLSETLAAGNAANQSLNFGGGNTFGVTIGTSNAGASTGSTADVAIGNSASTSGGSSVAIGGSSSTGSEGQAVALGYNARANGDFSSALGYASKTDQAADYSAALGYKSEATGEGAVALGPGTVAADDYEVTLGGFSDSFSIPSADPVPMDLNVTGNLTVHGGQGMTANRLWLNGTNPKIVAYDNRYPNNRQSIGFAGYNMNIKSGNKISLIADAGGNAHKLQLDGDLSAAEFQGFDIDTYGNEIYNTQGSGDVVVGDNLNVEGDIDVEDPGGGGTTSMEYDNTDDRFEITNTNGKDICIGDC